MTFIAQIPNIQRRRAVTQSSIAWASRNRRNTEAPNLWTGLAGLWLPGMDGFDKVRDYSGNNNDGTTAGGMDATDVVAGTKGLPKALNFNGSNQNVDIGTGLNAVMGSGFSIVANVWRGSAKSCGIVCNQDPTSGDGFGFRQLSGSNTRILIQDSSTLNALGRDSTVILPYQKWTQVAATWDGTFALGGFRLYQDGIRSDTTNVSAGTVNSWQASPDPITFGSVEFGGGPAYFDGSIGYVAIYSRVLTPSEIATDYSDPTAMFRPRRTMVSLGEAAADSYLCQIPNIQRRKAVTQSAVSWASRNRRNTERPTDWEGLELFVPGIEGGGTKAGDFSGNRIDGTLTNGPTWTPTNGGTWLPIAVNLDGTDDLIDFGTAVPRFASNDWITLSAWIKQGDQVGQSAIFSTIDTPNTAYNNEWQFYWVGDELRFLVRNTVGADDYITTDAANLSTGVWYHVVFSWQWMVQNSAVFYVDGRVSPATWNVWAGGSKVAATRRLFIGANRWSGAYSNCAKGEFADCRIYSRDTSASEILAQYHDGAAMIRPRKAMVAFSGAAPAAGNRRRRLLFAAGA